MLSPRYPVAIPALLSDHDPRSSRGRTLLSTDTVHPELIQHPSIRLVPHEVCTIALAAEVLLLVPNDPGTPLPADELHQEWVRRVEPGKDEPVGGADRLDVC